VGSAPLRPSAAAVASKYAHTPQGVLELRFRFFSESVNGPEGRRDVAAYAGNEWSRK